MTKIVHKNSAFLVLGSHIDIVCLACKLGPVKLVKFLCNQQNRVNLEMIDPL